MKAIPFFACALENVSLNYKPAFTANTDHKNFSPKICEIREECRKASGDPKALLVAFHKLAKFVR